MARIHELTRDWYGRIEDLIDDLKDAGYSVEEANREYISGWDEKTNDDVFYTIRLGGTEHTITIESIEIDEEE